MNNYKMAIQQIEADAKENQLNIVEGWSPQELERIFNLDEDSTLLHQAAAIEAEVESPNYFLIGGPYPNYNKPKPQGGSDVS